MALTTTTRKDSAPNAPLTSAPTANPATNAQLAAMTATTTPRGMRTLRREPMSRNRASAKAAGSRFERSIADCLAEHIDDRIDRRVKTGAKDKGDLAGWRYAGRRIVAELKDYAGQVKVGPWLNEAEVERGNDDANVGLVICKRRGFSDPLDQVVMLTVRDLISLTTGERP